MKSSLRPLSMSRGACGFFCWLIILFAVCQFAHAEQLDWNDFLSSYPNSPILVKAIHALQNDHIEQREMIEQDRGVVGEWEKKIFAPLVVDQPLVIETILPADEKGAQIAVVKVNGVTQVWLLKEGKIFQN